MDPVDVPPAHDLTARWPGQLAAIDIGSNSFRLEIGELIDGR
jgi:exopolyphosphatase/guanosine-5'-triphosphate,3'-diphosphate pyrophosphatase